MLVGIGSPMRHGAAMSLWKGRPPDPQFGSGGQSSLLGGVRHHAERAVLRSALHRKLSARSHAALNAIVALGLTQNARARHRPVAEAVRERRNTRRCGRGCRRVVGNGPDRAGFVHPVEARREPNAWLDRDLGAIRSRAHYEIVIDRRTEPMRRCLFSTGGVPGLVGRSPLPRSRSVPRS